MTAFNKIKTKTIQIMALIHPIFMYSIYIIYFVLFIYSLILTLKSKSTDLEKTLWVLVILCIPFLGSIAKIADNHFRKKGFVRN